MKMADDDDDDDTIKKYDGLNLYIKGDLFTHKYKIALFALALNFLKSR